MATCGQLNEDDDDDADSPSKRAGGHGDGLVAVVRKHERCDRSLDSKKDSITKSKRSLVQSYTLHLISQIRFGYSLPKGFF